MRYLSDLTELASNTITNASSLLTWCADNPGLSFALFLAYCAIPVTAAGERIFFAYDCGFFRYYKLGNPEAASYNKLFRIEGNNQCFKSKASLPPDGAMCYQGPLSIFDAMKDSDFDKKIDFRDNPEITVCSQFAALTQRKEL